MAEPFVSTKLENQVFRQIIFDERSNNKLALEEIIKNIGYLVNTGVPKEAFYSTFKQWLYDKIIDNYVKHSESISRDSLLRFIKKQYPDKNIRETRKTILETILKEDYKPRSFKPLIDDFKNQYNHRNLFNLSIELHNQLKDNYESNSGDAIILARELEEKVSKILITTERFRIVEEDAFQYIDNDIVDLKDRRENPEKYKGIPTGFEIIDRATGGWRPGELTIILGRPGMGKSILLMNFALKAYYERYNIVYVTIEMPIEQQKRRLYSRITNTKYTSLKMPEYLQENDLERIEKMVKDVKNSYKNNYMILDAPQNCNSSFIESRILAYENTVGKKVELLVVDPIYLMKPSNLKADDPVGTISWDLKILARKLNIPVICASQFNRESHKRHRSGMNVDTMDAAFSDKLSNNSDNMIGITGDKHRAKLTFPKSRDAEIEDVFLEKEFDFMRFKYDPHKTRDDNDEDEME